MAKNSGQAKFEACMVLSGVGDAIGYNNGAWEFCRSGYQLCMKDMTGRAPGLTCRSYRPHPEAWSERWVCNSV